MAVEKPLATHRGSFSSVKENHASQLAQVFVDSRLSSYARRLDADHDECRCHCHDARCWKRLALGGRIMSKSAGDLRRRARWNPPPPAETVSYAAGHAPLEKLPTEITGQIFTLLAIDIPPDGLATRNSDLVSLLLTSRSIHAATLMTLYKHITIPHSLVFRKFLRQIAAHPGLGAIVRRLDFAHFNPRVAGRTARERSNLQNLTADTLLQCLELTPNLQEFLAQEHVDANLSVSVLTKLLSGDLARLTAIDFCACSSPAFRDALCAVVSTKLLPLSRLGLHECTILPSAVFVSLLSRLPHLSHLDVTHTRVTDEIFDVIPPSARLTHLNLSRCGGITAAALIRFLRTPVARELVCLNLLMDAKSQEMLSANDVTELLDVLPQTLRSLNLKGSRMHASHIAQLTALPLEELGLGRHLTLSDIRRLTYGHLRYLDVSDLSVADLELNTLLSPSCPVLTRASEPLEVLELNQDLVNVLTRVQATCQRFGWVMRDAGRRAWLVRDGSRENRWRRWKMGATMWGMRKYPVVEAEVGGMYGLYMFKR